MKLSVELTMYPLEDDYIPAIDRIIEKLNSFEGIKVQTFPTATILTGDYDQVLDALKESLRWSVEACGKAVFVSKFLPNYEAIS